MCPLVAYPRILRDAAFVMLTIRSDNKIGVVMIIRKLFKNIFKGFTYKVW